VIVSLGLLTSLRFCRAKWTNRLAVHRLNGYDFAVLTPDDGELQKKFVKFCPKWTKTKPVNIFILSGAPF
jgi:hypothetical protein